MRRLCNGMRCTYRRCIIAFFQGVKFSNLNKKLRKKELKRPYTYENQQSYRTLQLISHDRRAVVCVLLFISKLFDQLSRLSKLIHIFIILTYIFRLAIREATPQQPATPNQTQFQFQLNFIQTIRSPGVLSLYVHFLVTSALYIYTSRTIVITSKITICKYIHLFQPKSLQKYLSLIYLLSFLN